MKKPKKLKTHKKYIKSLKRITYKPCHEEYDDTCSACRLKKRYNDGIAAWGKCFSE